MHGNNNSVPLIYGELRFIFGNLEFVCYKVVGVFPGLAPSPGQSKKLELRGARSERDQMEPIPYPLIQI